MVCVWFIMEVPTIVTEDALARALHASIDHFPVFENIVRLLAEGFDEEMPNQLLYGSKGIPHATLWDVAILRKYGAFRRQECVWNKQWVYRETPYFFEIDLANPNQPKDLQSLGDFLKEIMSHTCMVGRRHVFFLKNVDTISARGYTGMFRVLLERYVSTAWFVCSTYNLGNMEGPLRSRFWMRRVPSPSLAEIERIFGELKIPVPDVCKTHNVRDVSFALFLAALDGKPLPGFTMEDLCRFHAPFLSNSLKVNSGAACNIKDIRALTQKLTVHGYTLREITQDLLASGVIKPTKVGEFITFAANADHMCSQTDRYCKSLYIEWLLATALFGVSIQSPMRI
jgi:hypothetical protein